MLRTIFKGLLILVVLVAGLAFLSGYWTAGRSREPGVEPQSAPTSGVVNPEAIRQRGAELSDRAARAAERLDETLTDGSMTAKIKSKMALDEFVNARNIDVDTVDGVVTLRGVVHSAQERERAIQLAKETRGVRSIVDQLTLE